MSTLTSDEKASCADWTKIPVHCAECGVQFLRKVRFQKYCDEHRHLGGAVIRPQETLTSKEIVIIIIDGMPFTKRPDGGMHRSTIAELTVEIGRLRDTHETPVQPGELEQLRRIDKAARAFVEACEHKVRIPNEPFAALCDALFDGRPAQETSESVSAVEFDRYRRCLYRANGRLIQLGKEPEKLDYSSAHPGESIAPQNPKNSDSGSPSIPGTGGVGVIDLAASSPANALKANAQQCKPPCPIHLCVEMSKVGMCSAENGGGTHG